MHSVLSFFFFNDTATTEIYTLSLHDALPISIRKVRVALEDDSTQPRYLQTVVGRGYRFVAELDGSEVAAPEGFSISAEEFGRRSEEHTSELQSPCNLVCRLLLEKKKTKYFTITNTPHQVHQNINTVIILLSHPTIPPSWLRTQSNLSPYSPPLPHVLSFHILSRT